MTHDHPEGIKGPQAVASAVYLARTGGEQGGHPRLRRAEIPLRPEARLDRHPAALPLRRVVPGERVPPALLAFLESSDYEQAVRLAVSLGGDSDNDRMHRRRGRAGILRWGPRADLG